MTASEQAATEIGFVVCETRAAITSHARRVDVIHPVNFTDLRYVGHPPKTLCDLTAHADYDVPLSSVMCTTCRTTVALALAWWPS